MVDQGSAADNDMEWILEIFCEYLQSPIWKNPIISFVEEKCVVFENTEENRLDYTTIHNEFKRLVETKLEAYIQDLGISPSDFVTAQARAEKRIHKSLLQQIMAVEDFVLFKQMMVNRNIQMNKEAMRQMESKGRATNRIAQAIQAHEESEEEESEEEDEDEMMRRIMEESKKTAEADEARRLALVAEEAKQQAAAIAEAKALEETKIREEQENRAKAQAQAAFSSPAEEGSSSLPSIGGAAAQEGSSLPSLGGFKPKSTGLALFDEIEINDNDAAEVVEEKSQRQELKSQKQKMIEERNLKRQQETEAAEKARQAASETEDQEAKAARIQRGLQALSLAPTEADNADKRKNMYKNIRKELD